MSFHIGTAGWTLPRLHAPHFSVAAPTASHLQRYSSRLNCVEINSSFYRPHQLKTWQRWAATVPAGFRFSVKVPKTITHAAKLANCGALLQTFLSQLDGLGDRLGPLLIQLPPSLAFDASVAHEFLSTLRELHRSTAVLEPRHASWFTPAAGRLLRDFEVARVAADPAKASPLAARPGGFAGLRYFRLHGAPRTYYTEYSGAFLDDLAASLRKDADATETWVIFDNTALGHAAGNALRLAALIA